MGIQSPDPDARVLAIVKAGQRRDVRTVPLLVDRLEDEDEAVRLYAILALDKITGRRLGYDYAGPAGERAKAVARWRRFARDRGSPGSQQPARELSERPATEALAPEVRKTIQ